MATRAFEVDGYFRTFAKWRQTNWRPAGSGPGPMVRHSVLNPCCKAYTHPHPYGTELHRYPPKVIVGPIIELRMAGPFQVATVYDDHRGENVYVNVARGRTPYASPGWPNPDEIAAADNGALTGRQAEPCVAQCLQCGSPTRGPGRICRRGRSGLCGTATTSDYDDIECNGCGRSIWKWRHTCRHCGL